MAATSKQIKSVRFAPSDDDNKSSKVSSRPGGVVIAAGEIDFSSFINVVTSYCRYQFEIYINNL